MRLYAMIEDVRRITYIRANNPVEARELIDCSDWDSRVIDEISWKVVDVREATQYEERANGDLVDSYDWTE